MVGSNCHYTYRAKTMQHKSSGIAEMGDRLTTTGMDRKLGGCAPLEKGELGAQVTQYGQG